MQKELLFFSLLLLFPLASATIVISPSFDSVYSYGDSIAVNFSVEKQIPSSGYLETFLVCDDDEFLVSKQYLSLEAFEKHFFSFLFPVKQTGTCSFDVSFGSERVHSSTFEVSDVLALTYSLNAREFYPGEKLVFNGTVTKANGELLNGTLHFSSFVVDQILEVHEGVFSGVYTFSDAAPVGEVSFSLEAFERDRFEEILATGEVSFTLRVKPQPTSIVVIGEDSVTPPMNYTLSFSLQDQSNRVVSNKTVLLKVFDPERDLVLEGAFSSDDTFTYAFASNALLGAWDFNFYYGTLFSRKQVYVGEHASVSYSFLYHDGKNYLVVTNDGNIAYQGVVQFVFTQGTSEVSLPVNVDLAIGESSEYPLTLEGNYSITYQGKDAGSYSFQPTGASIGLASTLQERSYWIFFGILFLIGVFVVAQISRGKLRVPSLLSRRQSTPQSSFYQSRVQKRSKPLLGKYAYIVFFEFDRFFDSADHVAVSYGWTLQHVTDHVYFVLFYSSTPGVEKKLVSFCRDVLSHARRQSIPAAAVIHAEQMQSSEHFLKKFSSFGKRLLSFASSGILVSSLFHQRLGESGKEQRLTIEGKTDRFYMLS